LKYIENDIVLGMLKSQDFMTFIANQGYESKLLGNDANRFFYRAALRYHEKYHETPSKKILLNKLAKNKKLTPEQKKLYKSHLNKLSSKKFKRKKFLQDAVTEHFDKQKYLGALESSMAVLKKTDNVDAAEAALMKEIYTKRGGRDDVKLLDWLDDWEFRQEKRKLGTFFGSKQAVKTGFKELDLILDGIYPGEVLSIAGLTGRGKSIFATNVGANAFLAGHNVLHVTSENPLWQALGRYDARILKLPYKIIQNSNLAKDEERYADAVMEYLREKMKSNLKIAEVTPNDFSVLTLRTILHKLEITDGFKPDLVVLDSAELMNPIGEFKEYRLQKAAPYWDFKALMIDLGIAGLTTTQAKQKSDETKGITSEDLAEAYDKARLLDKIIGITRTIENILKNEITIHIAKNRDGDSGGYIKLPTDFEKITILN